MSLLFIQCLLAHILGDFMLQPQRWVEDKKLKGYKSVYLYLHLGIHFGLLILCTGLQWQYAGAFLLLTLSHGLIDLWKIYNEKEKYSKSYFFIDQAAHFFAIALLVYYYFPFGYALESLFNAKSITFLMLFSFCSFGASIWLKILLKNLNPISNQNAASNNAGKYIGILERLFIFFFVLIKFWEGIGFLLAAKSIFRFGDLKRKQDIRLTEYILIGTLLSFGMGILCGVIYVYLEGPLALYP